MGRGWFDLFQAAFTRPLTLQPNIHENHGFILRTGRRDEQNGSASVPLATQGTAAKNTIGPKQHFCQKHEYKKKKKCL